MRDAFSTPALSYVLATDALATVRGVLACLRRQTRADLVELLLVSPEPLAGDLATATAGLAAVREVRCPAPLRLPEARALGVRAASAPIVFVGETHSFPEPEMVEELLRAFEGPWAAVMPAIGSANPAAGASWAAYILDYGAWHAARPAGEIDEPLVYNSAFRRAALLALGDGLADGISAIDHDVGRSLRATGKRAAFAPRAQINHLNVNRPCWLLVERFYCGIRFGLFRAGKWGWPRRLLYAGASLGTPALLAWRARRIIRHHAVHQELPASTWLWLPLGLVARAAGEALGYLGMGGEGILEHETEIEVHRERYVRSSR
jgi:hypothetical protein